jgi:predicted TIM-barrel fold metal-dependent hydrolase
MNIHETPPRISEIEKITTRTDTRDYLAKAGPVTEKLKDWFVVDVDGHVNETSFWSEITDRIDNDVLRYIAQSFRERGGSPPGLLNPNGPLYQDVAGRIPHQQSQAEPTLPGLHRQVQLTQRAMDAMGLDYMVVFPTPMLSLGMHPQIDAEVAIGKAYNRWLVEQILPQDKRQVALLYLPFNDPDASVEIVEEFADKPGVVGFTIASTRHKPVWHNSYMRLYGALQECGKPLGFHAGFSWGDPSFQQLNRFIGMHSLSFAHFNMVHLTNWVLNGLPERFPKLKVIWIESGQAWITFLMQRLDSEYMMRTSECPLLKRLPSDYMREMYYTSQPLERSNMKLTQAILEAIKADTQLLYASDWPHWDFDAPNSILKLPFLSEQAKRNILGLSAAKLFGLEVPPHKTGIKTSGQQPVAVPAE